MKIVTLIFDHDATHADIKKYIKEALRSHGGGLCPEDDMFGGIDVDSIVMGEQ